MFTKTKTLDSILSTFTQVVADLEELVATNSKKMSDNRVEIASLTSQNAFMQTENERAQATADKIKALTA